MFAPRVVVQRVVSRSAHSSRPSARLGRGTGLVSVRRQATAIASASSIARMICRTPMEQATHGPSASRMRQMARRFGFMQTIQNLSCGAGAIPR